MRLKTKSKGFNILLKLLLNENVPHICISTIKDSDNFTFIDARERNEYDVSHIKNAVFAGYSDFEISHLANINKYKPIIVYCSIGLRSEKITKKLLDAGYEKIYNLYGGIFEWINQGKDVYDSQGNVTKKINGYNKAWGIWLSKGEKIYYS